MRVHGYRLYPLIAVALLAAATTWLERITRVEDSRSTVVQRHDPDAIVTNSHAEVFNRDGVLARILDAREARHFPDDGSIEMQGPRLSVFRNDRTIRLAAVHGIVNQAGDQVDLDGQVRGERSGDPGKPPIQLETETLTIWPDSQHATTHSPATLIQGQSRISGQRMQADNLFGTLVVTGSVRATILRTPKP